MTALAQLAIGIFRFPLATWFILISGCAQVDSQRVPRFEDYPVSEIFKGTPAIPKLRTPLEQSYADEIKAGVEYGYVVVRDGKKERGPNFAGDQIVIHWGCGAPCMRMAVVDSRSGEVHLPPISYPGHGVPSFEFPCCIVKTTILKTRSCSFGRTATS